MLKSAETAQTDPSNPHPNRTKPTTVAERENNNLSQKDQIGNQTNSYKIDPRAALTKNTHIFSLITFTSLTIFVKFPKKFFYALVCHKDLLFICIL